MNEEPELLTVSEVADMPRVSRKTIYRLVNIGEIPSLRIGHSIRIRRVGAEKRVISQGGAPL